MNKGVTKIDPILFQYEPHELPPYLKNVLTLRSRYKEAYAQTVVDGWETSKDIAREFASLANLQVDLDQSIARFLADQRGVSYQTIYTHLHKVIDQLHREHPKAL